MLLKPLRAEVIFLHKLIIIIPDTDLENVNNYLYVISPITQFLKQQKYC